MDESVEHLDVDDLDDAYDLDDATSFDGRPSRAAVRAARARVWVRRHTLPLGVTAAVVALAVLAATLWSWTHPATMAMPSITVSVDPSTSALTQSPPLVPESSEANPELVLAVQARVPDDLHVQFEGLSGTGVSMPYSAPAPLDDGESQVTVIPTVDCSAWAGSAELLASFRVSDGVDSRELTVRVARDGAHTADTAVDSACASYDAQNPMRVLAVAAVLDPVQPVVTLTWTLRNTSSHAWTVDGQSTGSDSVTMPLSPLAVTSVDIAASTTATVTSSIAVDDCADAADLAATGFSVGLSLDRGRDQSQVLLTGEHMDPVMATARQACVGAPVVKDTGASLTLRGTGATAEVRLTVRADVVGGGTWDAALDAPSWWEQMPVATRFPAVSRTVSAPAALELTTSYPRSLCAGVSAGDTVTLMLRDGGRSYPFLAPLDPSAPLSQVSCLAHGS